MTRPALVLVTTSFPIVGDGSEAAGAFVADLAEALAERVTVRVVAPGPVRSRERWTPDIEVFRYAAPAQPLSTLKPWMPAHMAQIVRVMREGAAATEQAVAAAPTTHMLALWALPSGYWARGVSRRTGVPYSIWALGSDIWSLGRIAGVRSVLRNVIRNATRRYADGILLGADAARIGGMPFAFLPSTRMLSERRTRALKSGPPYRFVFLGRWHPNKGIDLLLDALTLLDSGDWSRIAEIHIAGGGALEPLVRTRVQRMQTSGLPVRLSGFLDRAQASHALSEADYLLLPSRTESIPVIFSDAMKMRLPVVSMPVGDLPALVATEGTGQLAAEVSAPAFAAAIQACLRRAPTDFALALEAMDARFDLHNSVVPEILDLLAGSDGATTND